METARKEAVEVVAQRSAVTAGLIWAILTALGLLLWRTSNWWIAGDDGYYHIRIAADLREHGVLYFQNLDWARMSVFREGWGDKELLFHLFLIPFAGGDLLVGAKVALSLLNGVTAGILAYLGVRHAGSPGWLVPMLAVAMTAAFPVRMEQLRPHHISLVLLLLLASAAASRRKVWLAILGALYALSYTAWHLPIILCGLVFAAFMVLRRERRWELLWAPALGVLLGVLLHPGFPDNIRIWTIQNFQFFLAKDALPVGTEIFGSGLTGFAIANWRGFALIALGAALAWPLAFRRRATDHELAFGVFAAATLALYLGAVRFAEYAVPFTALSITLIAVRLGAVRRTYLIRAAVLVIAMVSGAWTSLRATVAVVTFNHDRYGFSTLGDMIGFGNALPTNARIAATWDFTPFYYFAAPQALYLNVLDPIYMWIRYPEAHAALERTFAGFTVDVPTTLSGTLGSDYIAYHRGVFPDLAARIDQDPRMIPVFESASHSIARVDTRAAHGFVTDWNIQWSDDSSIVTYSRRREAGADSAADQVSSTTGLVIPLRADSMPARCWWASRKASPSNTSVGFGASGPTSVYIDGQLKYRTDNGHAGLIDAVSFQTGVPRGAFQEWVVRACPHPQLGSGFFWRVH